MILVELKQWEHKELGVVHKMVDEVNEITIKSSEDDTIIFLWKKNEGFIKDIRTEYDIALKRKFSQFGLSSYKELETTREMLKIKKNVLKEELTPLQESIFEKVIITKEDKVEAKKYKDFKEYNKIVFNIILSEDSM